jgi:hypothetical protein
VDEEMSANERSLREAGEHFNATLDRVLAGEEVPVPDFWSPAVELVNFEPSPFPGTYYGHEGLTQWTRDIFGDFTDGRLEVLDVVEDCDRLAVKFKLTAIGKSSGIPGSFEWGALVEMRDGRCMRISSDPTWDDTLSRL